MNSMEVLSDHRTIEDLERKLHVTPIEQTLKKARFDEDRHEVEIPYDDLLGDIKSRLQVGQS